MDSDRKSKRGPPPLPQTERRTHCVSVRLNGYELQILDRRRGPYQRGEWIRMASIDRLPPQIPELNRNAWIQLSRASANLNQLAHHLNAGGMQECGETVSLLSEFRRSLIECKLNQGRE